MDEPHGSQFFSIGQRSQAEYCYGNVRWKNGVLQQLFEITEYLDAKPVSRREEWRDVPIETD